MKRIILPAIILLTAASVFGQTLQDAKVELFNTNDTLARNMLFELLKTDAKNKVETEYHLGVLYSYLRQNDSEALFLNKVLEAEPNSALGYVAHGRLALMDGDTVGAEAKFAMALNLAQNNKAFIYLEVGSAYDEFTTYYNKAITILKTALSLDSSNAFTSLTLASAYAKQGTDDHNALDLAENLDQLQNARRLNNKLTITWLREGGDLIKFSDFDMQEIRNSEILKKILQALNNGWVPDEELKTVEAIPDSSVKNMLLDSAIVCLEKATTISSVKISNAWLLLGNARYKRSHNAAEEAIKDYETAKALRDDNYYDACFNLGIVYNELNDAEDAMENLLKAYDLKPESADTRYLLAQCFAKLNKPDMVDYWLQKGLELRKPAADDYYLIGTAFGKVGHNLRKAIVYIEKAIALDPKKELHYEDLGVAYGINGQFDMAIKTSKKLVALNPDYAPAYINLAISYRNKGDKKNADYYQTKYDELIAKKNKR